MTAQTYWPVKSFRSIESPMSLYPGSPGWMLSGDLATDEKTGTVALTGIGNYRAVA